METPANEKLWNANYMKLWVANFMLFFSFMLLMPLLPIYLSDTFATDKQTIGIVLSGYTITALLVRPFSGFVVDSFPRKTVLLICYFLFFIFFAGYFIGGSLVLFAVIRTLHGAPFGATTVANSTVVIDVLPASRRAEGIGYYGLSNNIATALGPSVGIYLYDAYHNFDLVFLLALVVSCIGLIIDATIRVQRCVAPACQQRPVSFDRFFLLKGWAQSLTLMLLSFAYGIVSTYLAIYGREELGITGGTGAFFALFAIGLMLSRTFGSMLLRRGFITGNASVGIVVALCGYLTFAGVPHLAGYYGSAFIIGIGLGLLFPAFQNMFINMAEHSRRGTANSTMLTSWDVGIGAGILVGGIVAERFGYHWAFWLACMVYTLGGVLFFAFARAHFMRHRLR